MLCPSCFACIVIQRETVADVRGVYPGQRDLRALRAWQLDQANPRCRSGSEEPVDSRQVQAQARPLDFMLIILVASSGQHISSRCFPEGLDVPCLKWWPTLEYCGRDRVQFCCCVPCMRLCVRVRLLSAQGERRSADDALLPCLLALYPCFVCFPCTSCTSKHHSCLAISRKGEQKKKTTEKISDELECCDACVIFCFIAYRFACRPRSDTSCYPTMVRREWTPRVTKALPPCRRLCPFASWTTL